MAVKLSKLLADKFQQGDNFSKQLKIIKVFDLFREEIKILEFEPIEIISLKNKTLTVKVESSVAANELRLRESRIIETINRELGDVLRKVIYRF